MLVVGGFLFVRHCRAAERREKCEHAVRNLTRIMGIGSRMRSRFEDELVEICKEDPPEASVRCWEAARTARDLKHCAPPGSLGDLLNQVDDATGDSAL